MKLFSRKSSEERANQSDSSFSKLTDHPSYEDLPAESGAAEQLTELPDDHDRDQLFMDIKKKEFTREAEIFKALGHPIRLKIVYGLLKVGGCNVKNMQECLGLHQATVSQHLIHLKSRGIITSERQGLEMVYTVNNNWAKCVIDNIENNQKDPDFQG